jgi:hypothetical protein
VHRLVEHRALPYHVVLQLSGSTTPGVTLHMGVYPQKLHYRLSSPQTTNPSPKSRNPNLLKR